MSKESWLERFYPVPAASVERDDALAHSLRKWEGLLQKNMKAHKLESFEADLHEVDSIGGEMVIPIDSTTCALCLNYAPDPPTMSGNCGSCPLFIARGGITCSYPTPEESNQGDGKDPYAAWCDRGDAWPMVKWLRRAMKAQAQMQRQ